MRQYIVTAHRRGQQSRTLRLVSSSPAAAILTAMELLPGWLIAPPVLAPEWIN